MRGRWQKACRLSSVTRVPRAAGFALILASCQGKGDKAPSPSESTASISRPSSMPVASAAVPSAASLTGSGAAPTSAAGGASPTVNADAATPKAPFAPDPKRYSWLAGGREVPTPDATLEARFPAPPGYTRVKVEPGSFAEWLRSLPMAPEGTPAKSFSGDVTLAADDDYLAGVIAIDVGVSDLQQSSDVIVRLNAEWLWSRGEKSSIGYLSATKLSMPLSRWEKGQRLIPNGANVFWAVKTKPAELDYAEFRKYLDSVFNWANSTSLAPRSVPVPDPTQLLAGDFFLQNQAPNHVAVVLDVADKPSGERLALLGQSRNPAESMHVVRPGEATAWFSVRPLVPVQTPHSKALAWGELRRLPPAEPDK